MYREQRASFGKVTREGSSVFANPFVIKCGLEWYREFAEVSCVIKCHSEIVQGKTASARRPNMKYHSGEAC
jgi:hypothetical protein